MNIAKIKDNKPYCSKCESLLDGNIKDYFLVESNEENYFEIMKRCSKCSSNNCYLVTSDFDNRLVLEEYIRMTC